ncbi:hypothetical protein UDZ25_07735 [Serratia marcescens]|uniref:hypothetical protein n=1 Tax=Serratia TaxID=613 RepID=UPI0039BF539A
MLLHYHHSTPRSLSVQPRATPVTTFRSRKNQQTLARPAPHIHRALPLRGANYVRFSGVTGIISSSYDVFANAQRIVKVKEAKSEQRTVTKSLHPIYGYESLADKPRQGVADVTECAVFARLAIQRPNAALIR